MNNQSTAERKLYNRTDRVVFVATCQSWKHQAAGNPRHDGHGSRELCHDRRRRQLCLAQGRRPDEEEQEGQEEEVQWLLLRSERRDGRHFCALRG